MKLIWKLKKNLERFPGLFADSRQNVQNVSPRAVFGLISCALGVALVLWWLQGVVGAYKTQIFWRFTFSQDLPIAWAMAVATALAVIVGSKWSRHLASPSGHMASEWIDRHIGYLAVAMLPIYVFLAFFAGQTHPFSSDEYSVVAQSQIFAQGRSSAFIPPFLLDWTIPQEYQGHFLHISQARGELISSYWPGFALLLTPFSWLHAPWLCNPVVTCLSIWVLQRAARTLSGSKTVAGWAVVFFVSSPVIALNAATYYSMPAHLLANLLFCWLLALGTRWQAFVAGFIGSFALILHNPVPHALFVLPWLIWIVTRRRTLLLPLLAGYCVFLPLGWWWSSKWGTFDVTSDILAAQATSATLSQGPFLEILARLQATITFPSLAIWLLRLAGLCKLVVWATPGLAVWAWLGARSKQKPTFLRLLGASFVLTFVAFMFVRFAQGGGWGFRYLHQVWFVLPILAGWFLSRSGEGHATQRRIAALCAALSFGLFLPWRTLQVERFMRDHLQQVPAAPPAGASLRFIRVEDGFQTAALVQNDPFLRGSHWNLVDKGAAADAKLANQLLIKPRRVSRGDWGEIWVGEKLTLPRSRSK